MAAESHLVSDLALILISAGVITLIFKMLKQPLVLGYIVAGFLVGPHLGFFPTVIEMESIHQWSEIGIIFFLFALGLEFSFKKLFRVGSTGLITAATKIIAIGCIGFATGYFLGWTTMESIFLAGMLSMSSTVIVIKTFDDLGVKNQQFASISFVVLILEDLVAILLMVLLSTAAVSKQFDGEDMLFSIAKLIFFLILWFLIGIYVLPSFFRYFRKIMNEETLLIVSIGLCLGMVVLATYAGLSSALGAFVMGSILAETIEAERIEKITKSLKDLFGAIFFVSVGMMVDPAILRQYWFSILILTLITIFGKSFFSALGVLISGQSLRTSIQVGCSLSQIGEFAFIIASLGVSLGVLGSHIYPIIVAVAVITTFTTPYVIRLSGPLSDWVDSKLPPTTKAFLNKYASGSTAVHREGHWKKLIKAYAMRMVIFSVLIIAIIILSFTFFFPFVQSKIPNGWGDVICATATILALAPFLKGLTIHKKEEAAIFSHLWGSSRYNRGGLVALLLLRTFLVVFFVTIVLFKAFSAQSWSLVVIAFAVVIFILFSRHSFLRFSHIERRFLDNLNQRENQTQKSSQLKNSFKNQFEGKDIHLSHVTINPNSPMAGKTIAQTHFYTQYGVSIVKIERGNINIYLPMGSEIVFPSDKLVIMGNDKNITNLQKMIEAEKQAIPNTQKDMLLASFTIDKHSDYLGKNILNSGIRRNSCCMVVCIQRHGEEIITPSPQTVFEQGDIVWVVGEKSNVKKFL